jgi:predicted esterase
MPDVKALEEAVQALPPSALAEFRRWFSEFDSASWDRQIEEDVSSGKLDALLSEAEEDLKAPSQRKL